MSTTSHKSPTERATRKCLVNLAHLDPPNNGGASRLACEVARALLDDKASPFQTVFVVRGRFLPQFDDWLGVSRSVSALPYSRLLPTKLIQRLVKPDVIVSPLFGVDPFISTGKTPHVVSMPDTLALDHPELFPASEATARQQVYERLSLAQQVVTLSEFASTRLKHYIPTLNDRLQTIALGAEENPLTTVIPPIAKPYVFYPANSWLHKRHELLLKTMRLIWQVKPDLKLVLTGGRPPQVNLKALISQYAPADQVIDLGYVQDKQLPVLFAHAEALLFTSEYEGFGIPVIEAMQAGCPVICAPLTALPETAGDAALYVTSDTPEDWADTYLTRLPQVRDDLIRKGKQHATQFTWAKTRQQWLRLISRVADPTFVDD